MVIVTSLFNLVISSFPDNMFYHVWTTLLIYHDGSNSVVQVCSFNKPWTVCSNMHEQTCQQHCSSWPAQPCSRWPSGHGFGCASYVQPACLYLEIRGRTLTRVWTIASTTLHVQAVQLNHVQAGQLNHVQVCQQAKTSCAFLRVYKKPISHMWPHPLSLT